ncbi:hypothetical protein PR002_g18428 [Phytophthora rubi]|uniref:AMP-dependent synthetase/ligase domain-containing protein n=1 Tax=Phytophthora rubi TaxID=129364 RepID=A0A6A3K088_9STRA|nr:hypothetical protein PR002_g18428 [Phytophthora rubi]
MEIVEDVVARRGMVEIVEEVVVLLQRAGDFGERGGAAARRGVMVKIVGEVKGVVVLLLQQRDVTCRSNVDGAAAVRGGRAQVQRATGCSRLAAPDGCAASTKLLPFEAVGRKCSAQPGAADSPPPTDVPVKCYASGTVGDPKRVRDVTCRSSVDEAAAVRGGCAQAQRAADSPPPTDVPMMYYASVTVGDPKRVVLLQRNLTYAALGQQQAPDLHDEVQISYLPMLCVLALMFLNGASVGVYHGELLLLMNDIAALQPTVLVTVPRLVSGVYDTQGVDAVGGSRS